MSVSWLERAKAALSEEAHLQWRDWTRYLQAQLALLDARLAEQQVAFERDEALEERVRQAHATLAALPHQRRSLYDRLRDERVEATRHGLEAQQARAPLLDRDAVERQALEALQQEALGTENPDGWGVVPIGDGEGVEWIDVDARRLQAAPTAAHYALGAGEVGSLRARVILAGLLVAAGVLFCLVWFLWPRGEGGASANSRPAAVANGAPLEPWPLKAVVVAPAGDARPVTLSVTTSAGAGAADLAVWSPEHLVPLRLCLPADLLEGAEQLTLVSGAGRPDRVFAVSPAAALDPDLVLEPCDGAATPRAALLRQLVAPPDAALGEERTLADGSAATLAALQVTGPGDDPTLPPERARVTLRVRAAIDDWAAFAPTLLLADGQALLPAAAPIPIDDGAELVYLVPLPAAELPVVWSLSPPGALHPTRWRATLPVPPAREAVVRDALAVVAVEPDRRGDQLLLTLSIRNARHVPFLLAPGDLTLTAGSGAEAIPLATSEPDAFAPLVPGATRTFTLAAPLRGRTDALTLSVGIHRFRISWGE